MDAVQRALQAVGSGCVAAGKAVQRALLTCFKAAPTLEEPLLLERPRSRSRSRTQKAACRRYQAKKRSYFNQDEAFIMQEQRAFNPFDDAPQPLPVSWQPASSRQHEGVDTEMMSGGGGMGQRKPMPAYF